MDTRNTSTFEGWVILELIGYRRLAGYLREQQIGGASFLRIDVPGKDSELVASQFYAPNAVYAITPTTERMARAIADPGCVAPVQEWELPQLRGRELPVHMNDTEDDFSDDDDETPRETIHRLVEENGVETTLRGLVEEATDPDGVLQIAAQRLHQLAQGYTAEHDDQIEVDGQLAKGAWWLLWNAGAGTAGETPAWAFSLVSKWFGDRGKLLAVAGGLIAAEIDRLKRQPRSMPTRSAVEPPPAPAPPPEPAIVASDDDFPF